MPEKLSDKATNTAELKVFILGRETMCAECRAKLSAKARITLAGEKGVLCLNCSKLGHLVFLASGDATLTRRAKKHSALSAVVLSPAKRRNRYVRLGLLIEKTALAKAEAECLADADVRERRQAREAVRRAEVDAKFVDAFAARVRALYPGCPKNREQEIAAHACLKYSGRVGRSASAKDLEDDAVRLAVTAHVRHHETGYDKLLSGGLGLQRARERVQPGIDAVLQKWRAK